MNYWIFQAVPERYNLPKAIVRQKSEQWLVTRYWSRMSKGDIVYYWEGGKNAALHGWGTVLSPDITVDSDGDNRIHVSYRVQLNPPLSKTQLLCTPALEHMQLFRAPQGTNFEVSRQEAVALNSLIQQAGAPTPPNPPVSNGGSTS
jgi:hypothetical protein